MVERTEYISEMYYMSGRSSQFAQYKCVQFILNIKYKMYYEYLLALLLASASFLRVY